MIRFLYEYLCKIEICIHVESEIRNTNTKTTKQKRNKTKIHKHPKTNNNYFSFINKNACPVCLPSIAYQNHNTTIVIINNKPNTDRRQHKIRTANES